MLFAIVWENRAGATEETDKRTLKLFENWQPPAGLEFKGFYDYADANGGIAIAEANSAEVILALGPALPASTVHSHRACHS